MTITEQTNHMRRILQRYFVDSVSILFIRRRILELNELSGGGAAQPPAQIEYVSNKQVKYLLDLARQNKFSIRDLLKRYDVRDAQQLTRQQCSTLIDVVSGKAA